MYCEIVSSFSYSDATHVLYMYCTCLLLILCGRYHDIECVIVSTSLIVVVIIIRILNLYAEENAIEDALYYLGEALRKGVITNEVFLKVSIQTDNGVCHSMTIQWNLSKKDTSLIRESK